MHVIEVFATMELADRREVCASGDTILATWN